MVGIDYSMYGKRPSLGDSMSSFGQSLSNYGDMKRKNKLSELSMKQQELNMEQARIKAEREEEDRLRAEAERKRQEAQRDEFNALYQTQQMEGGTDQLTPEQMQSVYAQAYPSKYAEMQAKSAINRAGKGGAQWVSVPGRAGWQMNKFTGEYRKSEDVFDDLDKEKVARIESIEFRDKLSAKKVKQSIKAQNWKEASELLTRNLKERELAERIKDREQTEKWRKDKSPYEYSQKQSQLKGQMPNILQKSYKGSSSESIDGQDLTDESVKRLTSATEGASQLLSNTEQLMALVREHGLEYAPSEAQARMKTILSNISLQYKGEDFAKLGVLAGPDMEILLEATGNPTKFSLLSAEEQLAKMDQFRKGLIEGYNKKLINRGFDPVDIIELQSLGNISDPKYTKGTVAKSVASKYKSGSK